MSSSHLTHADSGAAGEGKRWSAALFSASQAAHGFRNLAITSNPRLLCSLLSY